jgi:signal transduction histidine kinase
MPPTRTPELADSSRQVCHVVTADGRRIPSEIRSAVLGRDAARVCVIRDVSSLHASLRARARAEAAERVNEQLELRNRNLEEFAHAAAHDLKSPLRAVANLVSWVEEDLGSVPPACDDYFRQLRRRLTHMEQLVDGLLLYARVGRAERAVEDFEPGPVIAEVIEAIDIPDGFPIRVPASLPRARGVPRLFQRVLQNLLSNAIAHHDRTTGAIAIECAVADDLVFSVVDDGPGVPERYAEEIFGMFKRLNAHVVGAGVGLALARRIVADHGGRIWVEPAVPRGARFNFTWPAAV